MRVLVTGAAGSVGESQLPALVDRGHEVRAPVRNTTGYNALNGVEVTENEFSKPGSFEASAASIDAAYYSVCSMRAGGVFEDRNWRPAHNLVNAEDKRGVDRVVFLDEGLDNLPSQLHFRREAERIRPRALVLGGNE